MVNANDYILEWSRKQLASFGTCDSSALASLTQPEKRDEDTEKVCMETVTSNGSWMLNRVIEKGQKFKYIPELE